MESYQGRKVAIHDNRSICAHAGACTDGLPSVFRMKQERWIDADAASVDEIIAVIESCPSGALSYSVEDLELSDNDEEPAVFIAPNGPYVVSGGEGLLARPGEQGHQKASTPCAAVAHRRINLSVMDRIGQ